VLFSEEKLKKFELTRKTTEIRLVYFGSRMTFCEAEQRFLLLFLEKEEKFKEMEPKGKLIGRINLGARAASRILGQE
jgi:hypothetical protein